VQAAGLPPPGAGGSAYVRVELGGTLEAVGSSDVSTPDWLV
jgi:hypothetical protein